MGFSRAKRVTDPLADEVRARLVGCSFSSGSDHTGDSIEDYDDSPYLSDLVQSFFEDEVETVNSEPQWCDNFSESGSDSDSEPVNKLPDFADDIAKYLKNSLTEDSYGRVVLFHVARSVEMLSSLQGSNHEHRAVFRRKVMSILRDLGHNAAICKTNWNSSGSLTAGNHEFIDVVHTSASSQPIRYIVDLDFASQFQIARPTANYTRVLQSIPAVFVGKGDDLKRILRLVCDAARISLKSRGLTLPPWRKNHYMQTRWLGGPYKRTTNLAPSSPAVNIVKCRAIGFDSAVGGRLFVRTR